MLEFDATVIEVADRNGRQELVLDRTCFYPGGGGQPCDLGILGGSRVVQVSEAGERIAHAVEPALPAAVGARVRGAVDAARRRDYREQHTGEPLFAQALKRAAGLDTVSVHFSDEETTIELAAPSIDEAVLRKAEEIANAVIKENRRVVTHEIDRSEAGRFPLRRTPPDEGRLRIVEVDAFDFVACCGVHAASTGEVFLIKVASQEKMRGHARLHLMVGRRAFEDYGRKIGLSQSLGRMLTCGEQFIEHRVQELLDGQRDAQRELKRLQAARAGADAEASVASGRQVNGALVVRHLSTGAGEEYLKAFVERVVAAPGRLCIATDCDGGRFQWIVAHSLGKRLELPRFLPGLLAIADAKGGGRGERMQGTGARCDAVERFAEAVEAEAGRQLAREGA